MSLNLNNNLLPIALILASFSILTACHTVEGTVQGAGEDIQSVRNEINAPPRHHHHKVKHTKTMTKKDTTSKQNTTPEHTTDGQSTQTAPTTNTNSSTNTNQTSTSY